GARGNTGRIWNRKCGCRTPSGHKQAVYMAVVVARKLYDHVAAGITPRQTNCAHRRFRTGAHQPHFFDARHRCDDKLRQFVLGFCGRANTGPSPSRFFNSVDNGRIRVTENEWSPGSDIVDVSVAIDIDQVRTLATLDNNRLPTDAAERPRGTI